MRLVSNLFRDERGATAVEYGLIVALLFLAIMGGVQAFASATIGMWNNVSTSVASAR